MPAAREACPVSLEEDYTGYTVKVKETVYRIGKQSGLIDSIISNGKEMLTAPVTPTIWRAPTDNDRKVKLKWFDSYFNHEQTDCYETSVEYCEDTVKIKALLTVSPPGVPVTLKIETAYIFGDSDSVKIDTHVALGRGSANEKYDELPPLPRFGFMVRMPEGSEDVRYFGYGPYEAYEDKKLASRMGLFTTTATQNFEHYVRPQENSAHYGCRFAEVIGVEGHGLYFSAEKFSLSVSHYSPHYLTGFNHDFELVPEKETTVIIDYRNAGIGSNSCGPALDEKYCINEKEFDFSFVIKPSFAGNTLPFREYRI